MSEEWRTRRGKGLSRLSAGGRAEGPTTTAASCRNKDCRQINGIYEGPLYISGHTERGLNNDSITNKYVRTCTRIKARGKFKIPNSFGVIG